MPNDGGLKLKEINKTAIRVNKNREMMLAISDESISLFIIL